MPRFVVLHHDWPSPHFDLLLEADGVLKAWRLLAEPTTLPVRAEPNFDHRLAYLDYEGPLTGNRGRVTRWDAGELTWLSDSLVRLQGNRLKGVFTWLHGEFTPAPPSSPDGSAPPV